MQVFTILVALCAVVGLGFSEEAKPINWYDIYSGKVPMINSLSELASISGLDAKPATGTETVVKGIRDVVAIAKRIKDGLTCRMENQYESFQKFDYYAPALKQFLERIGFEVVGKCKPAIAQKLKEYTKDLTENQKLILSKFDHCLLEGIAPEKTDLYTLAGNLLRRMENTDFSNVGLNEELENNLKYINHACVNTISFASKYLVMPMIKMVSYGFDLDVDSPVMFEHKEMLTSSDYLRQWINAATVCRLIRLVRPNYYKNYDMRTEPISTPTGYKYKQTLIEDKPMFSSSEIDFIKTQALPGQDIANQWTNQFCSKLSDARPLNKLFHSKSDKNCLSNLIHHIASTVHV